LGHDETTRAHIFPITVRDTAPALVYTWGFVQGPAIELLTQVAAAIWTAIPLPKPDLVTIRLATAPPLKPSWDDLTPAEQQQHFRAQSLARAHVAEMRPH